MRNQGKKNALKATLSDSESDDSSDSSQPERNYTAFVVTHSSASDSPSSVEVENSNESSESDEEAVDLQSAYDKLLNKSLKLNKSNLKLGVKLKVMEKELNSLHEIEALVGDLRSHNGKLTDKLHEMNVERNSLIDKVKILEKRS